jgi:hypothetical protein
VVQSSAISVPFIRIDDTAANDTIGVTGGSSGWATFNVQQDQGNAEVIHITATLPASTSFDTFSQTIFFQNPAAGETATPGNIHLSDRLDLTVRFNNGQQTAEFSIDFKSDNEAGIGDHVGSADLLLTETGSQQDILAALTANGISLPEGIPNFSLSAASDVNDPLGAPDGGLTVLLLGGALAAMAVIRRKLV